MNINETLYRMLDKSGFWYDCYQHELESFLIGNLEFSERQNEAEDIMRELLASHGKQEIIGCLEQLAILEIGIRQLQPVARDHVVHSLLTYLLGIFINETLIKKNHILSINPFQWKLTSLLHDIGYPLEISRRIVQPFSNNLNILRQKFGANNSLLIRHTLDDLEILSDGTNGLDLIQEQLQEWKIEINVKEMYQSMFGEGKICHGMISSITVLNILDLMYATYNREKKFKTTIVDNRDWNQKYFQEDIVPACSAIFIHNLGKEYFAKCKVAMKQAPLAFLLILADSLQEWERPFKDNDGISPHYFDISYQENSLTFYADIPNNHKEKIKNSLNEKLTTEHIKIA